MIQTADDLKEHLQQQRETFSSALAMLEDGRLRFRAQGSDETKVAVANTKSIIANIDEMLKLMSARSPGD